MRLAVSNLALPFAISSRDLVDLRALGVSGVEVAPTKLAPWNELTSMLLGGYRAKLFGVGLEVSSLQALLFGTEGLQLLGDRAAFEAMAAHLCRVGEIGVALGASIGVFGSPRNRLRGQLSAQEAWKIGRERLRTLAEVVGGVGFALGLEPVPPFYGGDFLTHAEDVVRMVHEVDHAALRVHLDTGCVMLGDDAIAEAVATSGPLLGHFHIAEPNLGPFRQPVCDHERAASALRSNGYKKWVVIEMLEQKDNPIQELHRAIHFARATYRPCHIAAQSSNP